MNRPKGSLPFHEAVLKTGTAFSASGTAVLCCRSAQPWPVDAKGLEEEVLMLALLHKKISIKKRHHQYRVNPLLCTRPGTGPSQMAGSRSVSCISNSLSNDSLADRCDIFKNSERDNNTVTSP